eukprot:TRINITY_DN16705_c0_g1_i1.p1 TRINITY_DN16705_c0_g1~~TRINITY_DN16705_c0_g1_i1.p1  ORF type:complete len:203 (+),score=14.49 TRINITY_DN16705_c0_g1_i1:76-684(+)
MASRVFINRRQLNLTFVFILLLLAFQVSASGVASTPREAGAGRKHRTTKHYCNFGLCKKPATPDACCAVMRFNVLAQKQPCWLSACLDVSISFPAQCGKFRHKEYEPRDSQVRTISAADGRGQMIVAKDAPTRTIDVPASSPMSGIVDRVRGVAQQEINVPDSVRTKPREARDTPIKRIKIDVMDRAQGAPGEILVNITPLN